MPFDIRGGITGGLGGAGTGAAIGSAIPGIGTAIGAGVGGLLGLFGGGHKEKAPKIKAQPTLTPEQIPLFNQLVQAGLGEGAGGAFGNAADYYRNILSDKGADVQAFSAPALRQYYQDIVPNISEQFAGMGSGGLSSSGFRNAQTQGAVDLAERLGALRANLRQSSAQGLTNIGQLGLGSYSENIRNQPQPSFGQEIAGGLGAAIPGFLSDYLKSGFNKANTSTQNNASKSSPYQQTNIPASPKLEMPNKFGMQGFTPTLTKYF